MASTIDNILTTLRAANILPAAQVNYGVTDSRTVPYCNVIGYQHTYDYQTGGVRSSVRNGSFTVVVVDRSQTGVEQLAAQIDARLNCRKDVTPQTMACFQESYRVGQLELNGPEVLYQFVCELDYSIQEDPSKGAP